MKAQNITTVVVYGMAALAIAGIVYGIIMALTGNFHSHAAL